MKLVKGMWLLPCLCALASAGAQLAEWNGRLATLLEAQAACKNADSNDCLPYMAQAEAVGQVLSLQVKLPGANSKQEAYGIVFRDGYEQNCSSNWLQSMNGQTLLHSALELAVGESDARRLNWVAAVLQAAQQLCHT